MQTKWNLALAVWVFSGVGLLASYLSWYAIQPKMTRIEWGNGEIEYFPDRVEIKDLSGLYQYQFGVKSRAVLLRPRLP